MNYSRRIFAVPFYAWPSNLVEKYGKIKPLVWPLWSLVFVMVILLICCIVTFVYNRPHFLLLTSDTEWNVSYLLDTWNSKRVIVIMYSCREGPVFTKSHPLALLKSNLKLIQVKVLFAFLCFNETFERAFLIKTRSNPDKSVPLSAVWIDLCHAEAIFVSGDLKSFVYARLASFSLRGL